MQLKVTQENLTKALNLVAKVASSRATLPVLSNVLLQIENNRLRLAATNLDIAITNFIGAQVQKPGSITVPARLFQDLIAGLPGGVIELEQDDQRLKITTERFNSVVNGISSEDFPTMPEIENGKTWSIMGQDLKLGLQQVLLAASNDNSRPVLTGVYFHTHKGELYIASTDSYRLAEKMLCSTKQEIKLLIPASALQDVLRIVNDYDGEVGVVHDDQQVKFQVGDVELVARLIEGNYPDYKKLIPTSFETTATLDKAELQNIIKVTSLFARESSGSVVISVDQPSGSIWIRAVASQLGENNATAKVVATGNGSITLNSRFIIEALSVIPGKEIKICFNGKLEPAMICDPAKNDYIHIIMPLKS